MISSLGEVMVYVEDQEKALSFWIGKLGFVVVSDENNGQGMRWIKIAPKDGSETKLVLHDKTLVGKMQPEMNLGTPSLMFYGEDLEAMRKDFIAKGIHVGDLVEIGGAKVFNFSDEEENYFAVREI